MRTFLRPFLTIGILGLLACTPQTPQTPTKLPSPSPTFPAPQALYTPDSNLGDLALVGDELWVVSESGLLRWKLGAERFDNAMAAKISQGLLRWKPGMNFVEPARLGPAQGVTLGSVSRIAQHDGLLVLAAYNRVLLWSQGSLRSFPMPAENLLVRDVAIRGGRVFAILEEQQPKRASICETSAVKPARALYEMTAAGAVKRETPISPVQLVMNVEGLWLSDGNKLFVQKTGETVFQEIPVKVRISRLQTDPKERLWILGPDGIWGGSLQKGVESVDGGAFFSGSREALQLAFQENILWVVTTRGLFSFDNSVWKRYEPSTKQDISFRAAAISGDKLFVTSSRGLLLFDGTTWTLQQGKYPTLGFPIQVIRTQAQGLWFGTAPNSGDALATGTFQNTLTGNGEDIPFSGNVDSLRKQARLGDLAVATNSGKGATPSSALSNAMNLSLPNSVSPGLFAISEQEIISLQGRAPLKDGILALSFSRDGRLWVGGAHGILALPQVGDVERFEETERLGVRAAGLDEEKGFPWFSIVEEQSGRGLGAVVYNNKDWVRFGMAEGLPSNEIYALQPLEKSVWLAHAKGVSQISAAGVSNTKLTGPILGLGYENKSLWAFGCQQSYRREGTDWLNETLPAGGTVTAFLASSSGKLFAATGAGLYRRDEGSWRLLPVMAGLPIRSMALGKTTDEKELLWIGTETGMLLAFFVEDL